MRSHAVSRTDVFKVCLKLVVLVPVVFAFFVQLHRYRSPEPPLPSLSFDPPSREHRHVGSERPKAPDQATIILVSTFGATTCLGAASLLFQYALRRCECGTSIIFFGVVGLLMVVNIVSELLSSGLRADMRTDYALMLVFLSVSAYGGWFESYSRRAYEAKIS